MHFVRSVCVAFLITFALARAQSISVTPTQTDVAAVPGFNHAPVRLALAYGSNSASDLARLSVKSDAAWVSGAVDTTGPAVVLTFSTAALVNRTYTATLTVTDGTTSVQAFVRATVAPLNVTKLLDDPVRSRMYGVQQDATNTGAILVIDPLTLTPVSNITVGKKPTDIAISSDGSEMLAICATDHAIVAIDLKSLAVRETIALANYADWSAGAAETSGHVAYGPTDVLYYVDGSWGPVLHVMKRSTRTEVQAIFIDGSVYNGAGNSTHGFGDLVVSPDRSVLYAWAQYGWSAGSGNSWPAKFSIGANGALTLQSGTVHTPNLNRDPLNTPALLTGDGKTLLVKNAALATSNVTQSIRTFPNPIFSMTPGGEIVATDSAIYDYNTGNSVYTLPAKSTVQAITSDYARLVYFDATAKALKSVNLFDKVGTTLMKRDSSPANQAIVTPPSELRWTPVSGVDRYQVYLGQSQTAVSAATATSPEYLGTVTGSSMALAKPLTAGTTYYWRVDVLTDNEVVPGQVQSFTVSSVAVSVSSFDVATVKGQTDYPLAVDLSSASAGKSWSVSSTGAWIKFATTTGTTPATLRFSLDTTSLPVGVAQGEVKITTSEGAFAIPVRLQVDPLALTVIRSTPNSALVYAISEYTPTPSSYDNTTPTTRAYLLEIDAAAEAIKRVVPVGTSATDLAYHAGDNRVYVPNWRAGSLLAVSLASFTVEKTYAFKPFGGMGYSDGDVYRVAAGGKGRLLVEEEDQWIDIRIYDTTTGAALSSASVREGGGQYAPDLRYYFHGDNNSSGAELRKFDTVADKLTEVAHNRGNISSYYGSRTVVVSEDGQRVFWAGSVFRNDLTEEWPIGAIVYSASADGRYAFSETTIYDVTNRKAIFGMPAKTQVSAFNSITSKLVVQQDQKLGFYVLSTSATIPAPVLSVATVTPTTVKLTWVESALQNGFTLQMRTAGSANWADVSATLASTDMSYTVSNLTFATAYEFRLKADSPSASSNWSNVASATTQAAPPSTPSFNTLTANTPTSAVLTWSVTGSYDTVTIERSTNTSATDAWTSIATVASGTTTYTDNGLTTSTYYTYRLKATRGGVDSPYSYTRSVTPQPAAAPSFGTQPSSTSVQGGNSVTLYSSASGNPTPTYQWYHNGTAIPGATNASLTIAAATSADAGTYSVTATNSVKSITSSEITLTVIASTGKFSNLSVLADAGGATPLTVGFTVTGGPKYVLVRGLGPTLAAVGVSGVLADPQLTLFRHGSGGAVAILSNNDWSAASNKSSLLAATSRLTGLPFISDPGRDCAVYPYLNSDGGYSVQVTSADGGTGLALVEVYDADSGTASRLANISALMTIGPGKTLTAGFVITGSSKKRALIRAVGPGLSAYGVASPARDPQLTVYRQAITPIPLVTNDNWGSVANKAELANAMTLMAFPLAEGSKDAAVLIDLDPGAYSVQASSVDGVTGPALIEVYDVP